ncbi:PaaI family thioesterase [Nocardia sp. alder85J]|uniref:PaaI family thioesterase n=1 Tax=Nocardia sp. alder85J TaxID=2862949 RepID=UPI001CD67308|nr:PaaI family thioesterase [Nocardia sp. alder85J]MCX4096705.1 PaaI family thioesterase [Nocardia sp. alder85J]
MSRASSAAPAFVGNGAETLVRVRPVGLSAQRAELIVETGPWLRDPAAGVARGALAVALDDVTGYVVAAGCPPRRWPVSLGIRLDLVTDPPVDASELVVTGELIARDARGGTTRGMAADRTGAVVALITQRSHLVPVDGPPSASAVVTDTPPDEVCIRDALRIRELDAGVIEMPGTAFAANVMGGVHGGILICGAEFAAMSALRADGGLRSTSIDMTFVRPLAASDITTFRAEVTHTGRSLAVVRVTAAGAAGKPSAIATVTVQRRNS